MTKKPLSPAYLRWIHHRVDVGKPLDMQDFTLLLKKYYGKEEALQQDVDEAIAKGKVEIGATEGGAMNWWDKLTDEQLEQMKNNVAARGLEPEWMWEAFTEATGEMPIALEYYYDGRWRQSDFYNRTYAHRLRPDWQRPEEIEERPELQVSEYLRGVSDNVDEGYDKLRPEPADNLLKRSVERAIADVGETVEEKPENQLPFAVIDGQIWDVTEMHFYTNCGGKGAEVHFQRNDEGRGHYRHISIDYNARDRTWTSGHDVMEPDDNFTRWLQAAFHLPFFGGEACYLRTQKEVVDEKPDEEGNEIHRWLNTDKHVCPRCHAINSDDWPLEVGEEIVGGGCQECWESGPDENNKQEHIEAAEDYLDNKLEDIVAFKREERRWELYKTYQETNGFQNDNFRAMVTRVEKMLAAYYNDKEGAE